LEELDPLIVGNPGTRFNVFLKQQQRGVLIQVWRYLGPAPFWDKREALVELLKVTVERGAVDLEPTGAVPLLERLFSIDSTIPVRRSME
jgi:hypothetical protein